MGQVRCQFEKVCHACRPSIPAATKRAGARCANMSKSRFHVIAAVNNEATLGACLARSPDIAEGRLPLTVIRGAGSMAQAYNDGLAQSDSEIAVFAHQDVYLPAGWLKRAQTVLGNLTSAHPDWQVAGPYGVRPDGRHAGQVWDVALGRELGGPDFAPVAIGSLDELLLIARRDDGFQFDPELPHFHLYGTDLVQSALANGRSAWAVELPVVHNCQRVDSLSGGYTQAYRYAAQKWRDRLPIPTTICDLTTNPLPLLRAKWRVRKVPARDGRLLADAADIAKAAGYEAG